ncbi:MAG: fatty acid oxidation complex subunit alpha FadB [Bdellovibrionales bacterium]|nr:fatty acid oxidation complex subunit alpha FadB [Bdellovibrionales bacterium]
MSNPYFSGNCIELKPLALNPTGAGPSDCVELVINLKNESVNKFNQETLSELKTALEKLPSNLKGLLLSSGKDSFLAGADITEFLDQFKKPETELKAWIGVGQKLFSKIEDLNVPTVCILNGFALGGGLEITLTCDYRIAGAGTKIGLPETKLGIIPGWGGTVRLPRLVGLDPAIEWITGGGTYDASDALKLGVVDAVVASADLRTAGIDLLKNCVEGKIKWAHRKIEKKSALPIHGKEKAMSLYLGRAGVMMVAGVNYPAPVAALDAIEKSLSSGRNEALDNEAGAFARVSKTHTAAAMVGNFLADQGAKKKAKASKSQAKPVTRAAVLGAGIMGGGIAYQSAISKVPIYMKDIKQEALAHGMREASGLLIKAVEKKKATPASMADTLTRITPTLKMDDLQCVQYVIEAVTENEKVKVSVLQEVENNIPTDAILTSNTSTISITRLAENLKRPEQFCGMHFFNPVPRMPLVEIIRGAKTSPTTIATAVQYALAMGKTPIVVNDCPGFLVNRVLFAYYAAFNQLIADKVDFTRVDKVMEKWGWPMGPAYLADVVGIDTLNHASEVMAKGFPDRMPFEPTSCTAVLYKAGRYGQKNGKGFYEYSVDAKGKPKKEVNPEIYAFIGQKAGEFNTAVTDQDIIDRLMLPFILESARCLADKIVDEAYELDLAMLNGLGFPPFRGGPIRYSKTFETSVLVARAREFEKKYGKLYGVTPAVESVLSYDMRVAAQGALS